MTKLYVDVFSDDGINKFAIFDDGDCEHKPCTENWRPHVFDTLEQAHARLNEYESERLREDNADPFTLEDAKKYAESHYWKFATTYAKSAPHEYLVKNRLVEEDKLLFERFVATIKANSVIGYFYGHKNGYLILGDHYYWFMPEPENRAVGLINRTTTDYLEYRDGAYYYKENRRS